MGGALWRGPFLSQFNSSRPGTGGHHSGALVWVPVAVFVPRSLSDRRGVCSRSRNTDISVHDQSANSIIETRPPTRVNHAIFDNLPTPPHSSN